MVAEHLFELGYKHATYIAKADPIESSERRRSSFIQTSERLGIAVTEVKCKSEFDPGWKQAAVLYNSSSTNRPTAVCCWCDLVAFSFLDYCADIKLKVPADIAVVGFDGFALHGALRNSLTTIRAPWDDVGKASISLLVGLLDGRASQPEILIPVEFVRGNTT
jgi:LacI family transcriptional regulator